MEFITTEKRGKRAALPAVYHNRKEAPSLVFMVLPLLKKNYMHYISSIMSQYVDKTMGQK